MNARTHASEGAGSVGPTRRPEAGPERLERLRAALRRRQLPPGTGLEVLRDDFERTMGATRPADGVEVREADLDGVPALRVTPPGATGTMLYLHGGGYVLGSPRTALALASRLAVASGCTAICPDYALAPERPHPAALDDAIRACAALERQGPDDHGFVLVGDSAGGGLAVAAAVALRDRGGPLPRGIACLSPWTDLTLSSPSAHRNTPVDPIAPRWLLERMATLYLGPGGDRRAPAASPRFAALHGLPPMLVHASDDEVLADDAIALAGAAERAGVDLTLRMWPELPHVWHGFAPRLPEAVAAIAELGEWIADRLAPPAAAGRADA